MKLNINVFVLLGLFFTSSSVFAGDDSACTQAKARVGDLKAKLYASKQACDSQFAQHVNQMRDVDDFKITDRVYNIYKVIRATCYSNNVSPIQKQLDDGLKTMASDCEKGGGKDNRDDEADGGWN